MSINDHAFDVFRPFRSINEALGQMSLALIPIVVLTCISLLGYNLNESYISQVNNLVESTSIAIDKDQLINDHRTDFLLYSVLSAFVFLYLYLGQRSLSREMINDLTSYKNALTDGDLEHRIKIVPGDEFSKIRKDLNYSTIKLQTTHRLDYRHPLHDAR
ncbi:hypothetical protein ACFL2V_21415, partial [Pseudomonadota bacterium]